MHTPCARAVVGRYSSHPPVLTLLLLVLLCCTAGCLATIPHHSMYGETSQKNRPTGVVREIPRRGQGAVQAYTTSAAIDSSDSKDNKNFEPIRIKAYTRDLNDPSKYCTRAGDYCDTPSYNRQYCHHSSVLTVRKRKILVEWSIPAAIKLHTDRLLVHRAEGIVKLRREDVRGQCGWYNIPEEHYTEGLGDADLHVYVSAAASRGNSWEFHCQLLENKRPIAVAINVEPMTVAPTESHIRTVAHEIAHGLGFDGTTFAHLKMISAVENDVRGKPHVFLVVSPKAKEVAQKYYNCSKAPGLELEDQGNSALSHFEMRNVRGELMSPKAPGGGSYSALTLAVFDDMPFYKANFSRAEPLRWANNSGCDFLEKKCIENKTSNFPDIFCTATVRIKGYLQCTYDRMALGQCLRKTYPEVIEPHFQYLWNAHLGGTEFWMDYCPYVEKVRYGDCTDGRRSTIIGSFVGPDARCVKGNELKYRTTPIGDVCVNTKCEEEGKLSVQFQGDDEWYQCEEGAHVKSNSANWSGTITCPKYADVCTRYPNITNKEPLPEVTDKDNEPAPANITWPIKPKDPSPLPHPTPEPTMETVGAPHVERELTSSNPNVPTDSSGPAHTTTPVQRDVFEKERIDSPTSTAHSETMLDQNEKHHDGLDGSQHGSGSDVLTPQTNSDGNTVERNSDARDNGVANGGGVRSVSSHGDLLTLNIGVGDGSVTPAGHAPLLLLALASVVAVVVPL